MVAAELKQILRERKRFVKQKITAILYQHQVNSTLSQTSETSSLEDQQPHCSMQTTLPMFFLQPENIVTPTEVPSTVFKT